MSQQKPTEFSLDVAYGSNATPQEWSPNYPSAMAYGFSYKDPESGVFSVIGSRPQQMNVGNQVYFCVMDTDLEAWGKFQSIQICFSRAIRSPNKQVATCPFDTWDDGKATLSAADGVYEQGPVVSAGCNLKGSKWTFGPYTASQGGFFECTLM